jgi:hypothetical protein
MYGAVFVDMKADLVKVSPNYSSETDPSPKRVHVLGKRSGGSVRG